MTLWRFSHASPLITSTRNMPKASASSAATPSLEPRRARAAWAAAGALAAITFLVYWPALRGKFLSWDDEIYILTNPMIQSVTLKNIASTFTSLHAFAWNPLTWISHMIDYAIWGTNPFGHHLTAVLLHCANSAILLLVLASATGALWRSAFVAALFALHPLHVESVAWISERKDVLSTLFWFLTMWAYLGYVRSPTKWRYFWVSLFLLLGLLSKPMLVSLPLALLLMDFWPLRRLNRAAIIEKIPWIAASAAVALLTVLAQQSWRADTALAAIPLATRLGNSVESAAIYIVQMFWPAKLSPFYPHPGFMGPPLVAWEVGFAGFGLAAISVAAWADRRRYPYILFGWLWYLLTLAPVIGIIQVGSHARADRYTYVPLVGIFISITWLAVDLLSNRVQPSSRANGRSVVPSSVLAILGAVIPAACVIRTEAQIPIWKDSMTLWKKIADDNPGHPRGAQGLGIELVRAGQYEEALKVFQNALVGNVTLDEDVLKHMGFAAHELGRKQEAVQYYLRAIKLAPADLFPRLGLARTQLELGNLKEAGAESLAVLAIQPDQWEAHEILAIACEREGRYPEALEHHRRILLQDPEYGDSLAAVARIRSHMK